MRLALPRESAARDRRRRLRDVRRAHAPELQGASRLARVERQLVCRRCGRRSAGPREPARRRWRAHQRRQLERYRRIGHDVAVRAACYVPLRVELFVCVLPDFLVAHVEAALRDRFSAGLRRDGSPASSIRTGCAWARRSMPARCWPKRSRSPAWPMSRSDADPRRWSAASGEVPADGVLHLAAREIAQVDNDPDHPDHGSIAFTLGGGR